VRSLNALENSGEFSLWFYEWFYACIHYVDQFLWITNPVSGDLTSPSVQCIKTLHSIVCYFVVNTCLYILVVAIHLSQHFRKKRRYSKRKMQNSGQGKCIHCSNQCQPKKYDKVGYDKDMESLKAELSKDSNDQCDSTITNFFNLTHEQSRWQSLVRITSILGNSNGYDTHIFISYLFYYEP